MEYLSPTTYCCEIITFNFPNIGRAFKALNA